MLTGKQRSYLRSMANGIKPSTQIGKNGITESFLQQLDLVLDSRELVKVTVLENSGLDAKEVANQVTKDLRSEFVQAIGSKFIIYRKNHEDPKIEFPKS